MLLDHMAAVVRVRAGRMLQDVEKVLEFYFLKKKNPGSFTWREDLVVLATHVSKAGTEPLSNWKSSDIDQVKTVSMI